SDRLSGFVISHVKIRDPRLGRVGIEQFVNARVDNHLLVLLSLLDRLFNLGQPAAKLFKFRLLQALTRVEGLFDQRPKFVAKRPAVVRLIAWSVFRMLY